MKLGITLFRVEQWFGEDIRPVFDLIELADKKGVDVVHFPEHVIMAKGGLPSYPFAESEAARARVFDENTNFWEPTIMLAWAGSRTRRIRLSTFVLLAALRPAALLAKQLSTLDVLSGGRLDLTVGAGWQAAEYRALGLPFEGRFGRMVETVAACKALWTQAPAAFSGKYINFSDTYCRPFPVQPGGPPILFGVGASPQNVERMAQYADGWAPIQLSLPEVRRTVDVIKHRMETLGRDPTKFRLILTPGTVFTGDILDVKATLAGLAELQKFGCTDVNIMIKEFCRGPEDFEKVIDEYVTYGGQLS